MIQDKRLDDTFFCVEATSNEVQHLWQELNQERGISWKEMNGFMIESGQIDIVGKGKMPVCVCLNFNLIRGKLICFYEATSRYVDHDMVEQWLKENVIKDKKWGGGRGIICNSSNTHHMLHAIQDSQKIWAAKPGMDPISFNNPRDLGDFLFQQGSKKVDETYKLGYGPKDVYAHESDLSCEDLALVMAELILLEQIVTHKIEIVETPL